MMSCQADGVGGDGGLEVDGGDVAVVGLVRFPEDRTTPKKTRLTITMAVPHPMDDCGGLAPHCGQAFAVVLTWAPHSLHFTSAIGALRDASVAILLPERRLLAVLDMR